MNKNKHMSEEEKELQKIAPTLFGIEKQDVFSVPEGFFSSFSDLLEPLLAADAVEEGVLPQLQKQESFAVPANYFNAFAFNLEQKIENEELAEMAPTLFAIEKENTFAAPKGYFDAFPTHIQEICVESSRSATKEWVEQFRFWFYRLAVPVAVACLVVYFGFNYMNNQEVKTLTAEEISQVLNENISDEDLLIDELTDADIEELGEDMLTETSIESTSEVKEEVNQPVVDSASLPEKVDIVAPVKVTVESEEEIIDYLLENDVDLSSIMGEM